MSELQIKALQVQIQALIVSWKSEVAERLADANESGSQFQRGYAEGLDRAVQALQIL
jgi:hypothetical protein